MGWGLRNTLYLITDILEEQNKQTCKDEIILKNTYKYPVKAILEFCVSEEHPLSQPRAIYIYK